MTSKAARILNLLLGNENRMLTVRQIAGVLRLSERTIATYLKEVYQFCSENEVEVLNKPGVGVGVRAGNSRDELLRMTAATQKPYYSAEYQIDSIVHTLLTNSSTYTISLFAEDLNVSKNTVESDLQEAEAWLSRFDLSVRKKAGVGISLQGKELDIRRAIVESNRRFFEPSDQKPRQPLDYRLSAETYQRLRGCCRGCDVDFYIRLIQSADRNSARSLTDSGFETLLEYLAVMDRRISEGFLIPEGEIRGLPDDRPNMRNYLSVYVDALRLPPGEQEFLKLLACCMEYQNAVQRSEELISRPRPEILDFTQRLISYLSNIVGLDFTGDELLRRVLYLFERSSLLRVRYGIDMQNPFREDIKKTYPAIFSACFAAGRLYEREVGRFPAENELAFLSLYIGGAIVRSEKKMRVVVVCSAGVGTGQILARRMHERFPEMEILAVLPASETRQLAKLEPMLVITTTPAFRCDYPTVAISPVLDENAFRKLRRACSELYTKGARVEEQTSLLDILREELVFLDVEGMSKTELLQTVCGAMEENGYVSGNFYADVLGREQMGSTALGQGVAIPHGMSGFVRKPAVSLVRLRHSIDWGGEPVDIVFLLALNFSDIRNTKAFFNAFYQITNDAQTLGLLRKARTREEIRQLLAEHCIE